MRQFVLRILIVFSFLYVAGAAQQLHVKSATARSVELEWSGAAGPATVERTAGTAIQKLAIVKEASYEDKTIDPFATYIYRILAGSKSSNEVRVGPPPAGVNKAALVPAGKDPGKYGQASALALDENGDPVIAFERVDPNGDNEYSDNEIDFVRWDRAAYRWLAPVKVKTVGEIPAQNLNPIAIACDRRTGVLAITTPVVEKGAVILLSKDRGATWNEIPIAGLPETVKSTVLGISGGTAYFAFAGEGALGYLSGRLEDVSSWKREALPANAGWKQEGGANVGLAMDATGKPVVAWYETREEGEGVRFEVWRPGGNASTAMEAKHGLDSPSLAITAGGGKIGLLGAAVLAADDTDHGVWYAQSSDGASWSKPSMLPVDGPRSTNPPLDVAVDSRGRITTVFGSNSGGGGTTCNYPVLSRSSDGVQWKTCGPGHAEGGDFSPQPATLHIVEAGNDKVYVLWQEPSENKFGQGMLLWHEH